MNFLKKYIFLPVLLSLSFVLPAYAQEEGGERIDNYDTTIQVNTDGSVDVTESILYNFADNERHGIFRDIPIKYRSALGKFTTPLSDYSVTDEEGNPYAFVVSGEGSNERLKIGDADVTITGIYTYVIRYKVHRSVGFFDSFDEIYRNAPGHEWDVPIQKSRTTVILPQGVPQKDLRIACYQGAVGSTESCAPEKDPQYDEQFIREVRFYRDQPLAPGEGVTVAVGFPKGIVEEPSFVENAILIIKDNWIIPLPLFVLIFLISHWRKKGKDPKGTGVIVAQYDAPKDLSALESATLLSGRMDSKFLSGEMIYLAVHGHIKITRTEEKGMLWGKTVDYEFSKIRDADPLLSKSAREVFDGIFSSGGVVKLSDLKDKFYKQIPGVEKAAFDSLISKGYFPENPRTVMGKYIALGVMIIFFGFFLGPVLAGGLGIAAFFLSGLLFVIFGFVMPRVTPSGALQKEYLLGLKDYLQIAEKDRLAFHNAPEKSPALFEKLLPYAIVFGVEGAWAKEFQDIYKTPPSWYSGPVGSFNAVHFSSDLKSFSSAAAGAMASSPSSSSGSGGGGFSGGGGGGGGGGSW